MNTLNELIKIIGAVLILIATIALPAIAIEESEMSRELSTKIQLASNTAKGVELALKLRGRALNDREKAELYRLSLDAAERVVGLAKRDGVLEEYMAQLNDPEIRKMDEEMFKTTDAQKINAVAAKQMSLISKRYPKVYMWALSSREATEVMAQFMNTVCEKFN